MIQYLMDLRLLIYHPMQLRIKQRHFHLEALIHIINFKQYKSNQEIGPLKYRQYLMNHAKL